jgi:polysaccharide deacetylase 2 family uncharacterized protein YibQ
MLKAPTFAKRPSAVPEAAAPAGGVMGVLANPAVGAAGAALVFLAAGATLISVTGDPNAGAPQVRVSLEAPNRGAAGGGSALRPTLSPDGQPVGPATGDMPLGPDAAAPGSDPLGAQIGGGADDNGGQAVITLPQGASLGGGQGAAAPRSSAASPLAPAPIAGVSAPGPGGLLPVIGKDGKTPFQAYARPFQSNGRPKIALVVGGLGLNAAATRAAIDRLPAEVTLSFVPYADGLQTWIDQARAAGHEVLLEIPMEPLDYPNNDPGPSTLMANAPREAMVKRLEWLLARASGYFGVTNYLGGRFVTVDSALNNFAAALKGRGLGFIDDGSAARRAMIGLPRASADTVVDEQLSQEQIDRQLMALEATAGKGGQAMGFGFAYPVTINEAARWSAGLAAHGYQLAPASALAHR